MFDVIVLNYLPLAATEKKYFETATAKSYWHEANEAVDADLRTLGAE